jgi:hypothetical protein
MPPPILNPQTLNVARRIAGVSDDAGDAIRQLSRPIRAYHGSPHSFDAFDASKIGTGEGAQAYGHGLYFAGNEDTAGAYRRRLASGKLLVDGRPLEGPGADSVGYLAQRIAAGRGAAVAMDVARITRQRQQAAERLAALQARWDELGPEAAYEERGLASSLAEARVQHGNLSEQLDAFNAYLRDRSVRRDMGHMYEVEIGHPEESLLDWDAPMSRQPKVIQKVFGDMAMDRPGDGGRVYRDIATRRGEEFDDDMTGELANLAASQELLAEGIPGIRYLDQGSRSAGQGTHNYVIFPGAEDRIRILRKYGLLAPMAAGAAMEEQ